MIHGSGFRNAGDAEEEFLVLSLAIGVLETEWQWWGERETLSSSYHWTNGNGWLGSSLAAGSKDEFVRIASGFAKGVFSRRYLIHTDEWMEHHLGQYELGQ